MSALVIAGLVAAAVAAALHVVFFVLESVLFTRPSVRRLFGVRAADDSRALRLFARNQGVYNLGLAALVAVGLGVVGSGDASIGTVLIVAGCAVMALAALALVVTAPRLWPAALAQGTPPVIAVVALLLG